MLAAAVWIWTRFGTGFRNDFIQYWAAGRLVLQGSNPYDPEALFSIQRASGWARNQPAFMFNPPWTLSLFLPLALLPAGVATAVWILVQVPLTAGCAAVLWREFGGSKEFVGRAILIAFAFPPLAWTVMFGQASVFLLLGVTLFLLAARRSAWALAGAGLALTAVKPHMVLLLWLAVVLSAVHHRRPRVLLGGLLALVVLSALPLAFDARVFHQYLKAFAAHPPNRYVSDTLGMGLRLLAGRERLWVQFVPLEVGLVWTTAYWWSRRARWSWLRELPLLALVSATLAPYGWFFDLVLALPALLEVAVRVSGARDPRVRRFAAWGFLAFCGAFTVLHVAFWDPYAFVHGWLGSFLLIAYVWLRRTLPEPSPLGVRRAKPHRPVKAGGASGV